MLKKINRAYKYRFYPTEQQKQILEREFGNARFVWNSLLFASDITYQSRKEFINMSKTLTEMKKLEEFSFLKESHASILDQKRIDLETAYKNFFRRLKQGKRFKEAGFPKYKSKGNSDSIRMQLDQRRIENQYSAGHWIRPNKELGRIEFNWTRIPSGVPKMLTISRNPDGKYYLSFSCEETYEVSEPNSNKSIGIDFGMKVFATLSNGIQIKSPLSFAKAKAKLRYEQRVLSRRTKGSNRKNKQRLRVARLHGKIANQRSDFLHKFTNLVANNFDVICVETLDIKNMQQKFGKSFNSKLADVSISETIRQLEYKCFWRGKQFVKIDKWFPSSKLCSKCGTIHNMPLSQRSMTCDCGNQMDRDLNASINIRGEGLRSLDVEVGIGDLVLPNQTMQTIETLDILTKKIVLDAQTSEVVYQ